MVDKLEQKLEIIEKQGGKSKQVKVVENFLQEVEKYMTVSNTHLTNEEKEFAIKAINHISERLSNDEIGWNNIAVAKCRLPEQIKEVALKGLSFSDQELYLDIRNNKANPKDVKDIAIKVQYQGAKKEIIKFCDKNIVRFKEIILVEGEKIQIEEDFRTGLDVVVGIENKNKDRDTLMNDFDKVTDVYIIAYEETGSSITQHIAHADKQRLKRARDAASTKRIWDADTKQMLIKTGYWVLRNNVLAPFITHPKAQTQLLKDDVDFDKDVVESQSPKEVAFSKDDFDNSKPVVESDPETGEILEDKNPQQEKAAGQTLLDLDEY